MGIAAKQHDFTGRLPTSLIGLQKRLIILRPIRNRAQYHEALEVASELSSRAKLTSEQNDYLEVLTGVISRYEEKHFLREKHSPRELLAFLLEENNMNASDLGRLLGNRTLGPAILRGQRSLSKTHIRKLAERFSVSPALFME